MDENYGVFPTKKSAYQEVLRHAIDTPKVRKITSGNYEYSSEGRLLVWIMNESEARLNGFSIGE